MFTESRVKREGKGSSVEAVIWWPNTVFARAHVITIRKCLNPLPADSFSRYRINVIPSIIALCLIVSKI